VGDHKTVLVELAHLSQRCRTQSFRDSRI